MESHTKLKNKKRLWMGLRSAPADFETVKIHFFYADTFNKSISFTLNQTKEILKHNKFDNSRKTLLYFHGYVETMEVESIYVIVSAYIKRNDHNILILDWSELAEGNYLLDAVPNMSQLGTKLAEKIIEMSSVGLDLSKVHIVGHSLGGQLAGTVARNIYQQTKKQTKIKRVTALDPAFPGFYPPIFKALSANDAAFVDIIHTDAWLYGAPSSTGTADFWPNGGKTLQPGCPKRNYKMLTDNDLCSHRRSWRFWAESVENKNEKTFHGVKCKSWSRFKDGKIENSDEPIYMGIDASPNLKGDYYLQTNGDVPYSKGEAGMKYEEEKTETKS